MSYPTNSSLPLAVGTPASTRRVLLGIGAGIAAYKSAELVRRLREAGFEVRVVMTARASEFVGATTFAALSGNTVRTSLWDETAEAAMSHIELARWADLIAIAPATADLIARLAHGLADDLLTTLALASRAPLLIAPAMNQAMWVHAATQANVELLTERGVRLVGPAHGEQACGDVGAGRMSEPQEILDVIVRSIAAQQPIARGHAAQARSPKLRDRHVLITAGPTFEDIDPVRFIGNRSSGRMGFALADAAREAGARVTLIAGPVALPTPAGVERVDVRSAAQMLAAVRQRIAEAEIFIANAAVADYRMHEVATDKIKKKPGARTLELVPTVDIVSEVASLARAARPLVVGFAAETSNLREHALGKLENKKLDLIVANPVGATDSGFEVDRNQALALWSGGERSFPAASKAELAAALMDLIAERFELLHGSRDAMECEPAGEVSA